MAEFTAVAVQTVAAGGNILFMDDIGTCCRKNIFHRPGTGIVKVKGDDCRCLTRIRVFFSANIAIPTGGTVGPISVGISVDGEVIPSTISIFTPAAVEEYGNVVGFIYLDIPQCCSTIGVVNNSDQAVLVQNANLIVARA